MLGEQPGREKGTCGQEAGMLLSCPKMSMRRKAISTQENQKELPVGGPPCPGMEEGKEETEFSPSERSAGPA